MNTASICAALEEQFGARLLSLVKAAPPSDIDIYLEASKLAAAEAYLNAQGYINTGRAAGQSVFRRYENNGEFYVLDLMTDFRCYQQFASGFVLTESGHTAIGQSASLHRAIKALFTGQSDKLTTCLAEYPDELKNFLATAANFTKIPAQLAGVQTAPGMIAALHGGPLQQFINRQQLRLRHLLKRLDKGKTIALIGPDGSGKSFFIEKLKPIGETKTIYMGDFFFVLQPIYNALMKIPSPYNRFVYLLYPIENFLRWLKVRLLRLGGKIVLIDRYPGTNRNIAQTGTLKRLNDLTFRFFPRPDILVLLLARPETVYARKQELNIAEITKMQTELQKLIAPCRHIVLDTEQLDVSLNRLLAEIMR